MYINFGTVPAQFTALFSALILCSLLGTERYYHNKNAGIKTYTLVGMGACVFTLVASYGFFPVVPLRNMSLDPTRIAAQVVSGIGFVGAGVIFINNDKVRGLTTAATFWIAAAIGMACGAHLLPLATFTLVLHYFTVFILAPLLNHIPVPGNSVRLIIEYAAQQGVLPKIMMATSAIGCKAMVKSTQYIRLESGEGVRVIMEFEGSRSVKKLIDTVSPIEHVHAVDVATTGMLE